MNVMITSVSRKVTLVRAFQSALDREGGGEVVAVDASQHSAALYEADIHQIAPYGLDSSFLDSILEMGEKYDVKIIVPTRDEEVSFLSSRRGKINDAGMRVMAPSPQSVEVCQDKMKFIDHCIENDIKVPKVYTDSETKDSCELPVFVRGRFGKGGSSAYKVESQAELHVKINEMEDPIVQEYVDAPEYTVDLFADFRGEVISVVPRERVHVFGGESFVGRTVRDDQIINEAVRLSESLNLVGHNTIQCFRRDNDEVHFIEVNPRYGGGASLGFASGAFTPQYLVRLLQGKPVPPRIGEFEEGRTMLRYTQDLFLDKDGNPRTRPW